jgi:hypothetical protein
MIPPVCSSSPLLEGGTKVGQQQQSLSLKRQRTSSGSLDVRGVNRSTHSTGAQDPISGQNDNQSQRIQLQQQTLPMNLTAEHLFEMLEVNEGMNGANLCIYLKCGEPWHISASSIQAIPLLY